MKKEWGNALVGHLSGCVLLWVVIHFWAADFHARITGYSVQTIYRAQLALLTLWCIVRTVRIIQGKDGIAQLVDQLLNKKK